MFLDGRTRTLNNFIGAKAVAVATSTGTGRRRDGLVAHREQDGEDGVNSLGVIIGWTSNTTEYDIAVIDRVDQ